MKQFFKFMFASMLGFILAGVLLFFIFFAIVVAMVSSVGDKKEVTVNSNSVLEIKFEQPIKERTPKNPFDFDFDFNPKQDLGLNDILKNLEKAKDDSRIKGIFLNLSSLSAGIATIEEIRHALVNFKKSGKFIYAYAEDYRQSTYYLASVADKIFLNPQGFFDMRGLHAELTFFKGALDKLDIEPQVIRHGKFKSAVEPFINEKMSPENRQQISTLINSVWNRYVSNVAASRSVSEEELRAIATDMKIKFPEDAVSYKLVDRLAYYDEVQAELKKKIGLNEKEKIKTISLKKYDKATVGSTGFSSKKKIALIYAVGPIGGGKGNDEAIGSDRISEAIRKARLDSSIKAIVLRVNSPGGSALASDVIWREMTLAKKAKPVVVSMGDVAASGGYYISCAADTIVAEPNTITGSIGVFGLLFNAQKLFNQKLGITFDTVNTGRFGGLGSLTRPLTAEEREIIQMEIERIYDTFISHVADGRKMDKALVDSIGQGRVWSGTDAKNIGLVDVLGGVNTAVEIAARMAKVSNYRTVAMPEQEDILKKLLNEASDNAIAKFAKDKFGDSYKYYEQLQSALRQQGIVARMPFEIEIY